MNSLPVSSAPATPEQPQSTMAETATRETFQALMWALSYPGRIYSLPAAVPSILVEAAPASLQPFVTIGQTLLDLEVSYFTPVTALDHYLAQTLAQPAKPTTAHYHFYPYRNFFDDTAHLSYLQQAAVGTLLYPDESATLVVACGLGSGTPLQLHGPGIQTTTTLAVTGLPTHFWQVRAERIDYPLGLDLILVDGHQVAALPRTTGISW